MVVVAFIGLFQDLGLKQALVQRKDADPRLVDAAFWGSVCLGALWFGAVYLAAPGLAELYRNPDVVPVLRVLGGMFLIAPLGSVPEALLLRDLAFRRLFWVELLPSLVPGLISIALALAGLGVWALVWGTLAGATLRSGALWLQVSWRPRLGVNPAEWPRLLRFGGWVSVEAVLGWAIVYLDQAFAGRFLGATSTGFYRMGLALALFPAQGVSQTLSRMLFPAYSRLQDERERLREGLQRCIRVVAILSVPTGVAFVAFADPLIPLLLGERWRPTVDVVRLLAVSGVLASLVSVAPPLYKAIGRVDIMPKFFLVRACVSVPVYWWAAQRGLLHLATAKLVLACCFAPVNLWVALRMFRASLREALGAVAVAAAAAGAALLTARGAGLVAAGAPPVATLVAELVTFAAVYLAVLAALSSPSRQELAWLARNVLRAG
jgi:lipopolysaccharide exporter